MDSYYAYLFGIVLLINAAASNNLSNRGISRQLEHCNSQLGKVKNKLQNVMHSVNEIMEDLDITTGRNEEKISFHALLACPGCKPSHYMKIGNSQAVKFDKVITNNGNAYNSDTGYFTAPRSGTYFFTTSFRSSGGGVHLQMVKNEEELGVGAGYPAHGNSGSISATVNLKKGDVVAIRHWPGRHEEKLLLGNPWAMFTGFIL